MKREIFEGTAVPSAVPPSHPARQKGEEEMGLLPSLLNPTPLLDTEEHQIVALQEHYTFD